LNAKNTLPYQLPYACCNSCLLITLCIILIYKYYGWTRNFVFIHRILSKHGATLSPHKSSLPFCAQIFRKRNIFITKVVYIILYTLYIYIRFFLVLVFYVRHFYIILLGRWNLIEDKRVHMTIIITNYYYGGSFVFHHHNNVITSPTLPGPIFLQNRFNVSQRRLTLSFKVDSIYDVS